MATGGNGFIDASAIDTVSAFTLSGAGLTPGDIVLASLSATQGININLGGMSGTISAAAVDTDGAFVLTAASASNLQIDIETLSAGITAATLGCGGRTQLWLMESPRIRQMASHWRNYSSRRS